MNEREIEKSSYDLFFYTHTKFMNGFMSWHLWAKDVLSDEVVEKLKLNVNHFFMLKTNDDFRMKNLNKVKFLALLKPIMATKS